jgi:hypothetical protein
MSSHGDGSGSCSQSDVVPRGRGWWAARRRRETSLPSPAALFCSSQFRKPIPKYSKNSGLYSAKRNKIAAAAGTGYALSKGRGGGPNQLIYPLGCRFVTLVAASPPAVDGPPLILSVRRIITNRGLDQWSIEGAEKILNGIFTANVRTGQYSAVLKLNL